MLNLEKVQRPSIIVVESYAALGAPTELHTQIQQRFAAENRMADDGATLTETFFAVVKSFFGSTVLYLPFAIAQTGTVVSFFVMGMCAALCIFACLRLLRVADQNQHLATYGQIAEAAGGRAAEAYIQVSLLLVQCGFALTYFVFVARNLHVVITSFYPDTQVSVPAIIAMVALLQVPMSQLRTLKKLSYTNTLSCVLIGICCSYMLTYSTDKLATEGVKPVPLCEIQQAPMMVGTAIFAFEGIGLLLPLRQSLRPKDRPRYPLLIVTTLTGIALFYFFFSLVNLLAFGMRITPILTAVFPFSGWSISIQLMYSLAVFFTIPLQLFPAQAILAHFILGPAKGEEGQNTGKIEKEKRRRRREKAKQKAEKVASRGGGGSTEGSESSESSGSSGSSDDDDGGEGKGDIEGGNGGENGGGTELISDHAAKMGAANESGINSSTSTSNSLTSHTSLVLASVLRAVCGEKTATTIFRSCSLRDVSHDTKRQAMRPLVVFTLAAVAIAEEAHLVQLVALFGSLCCVRTLPYAAHSPPPPLYCVRTLSRLASLLSMLVFVISVYGFFCPFSLLVHFTSPPFSLLSASSMLSHHNHHHSCQWASSILQSSISSSVVTPAAGKAAVSTGQSLWWALALPSSPPIGPSVHGGRSKHREAIGAAANKPHTFRKSRSQFRRTVPGAPGDAPDDAAGDAAVGLLPKHQGGNRRQADKGRRGALVNLAGAMCRQWESRL
jgi:proton-coupled amino acid transporter